MSWTKDQVIELIEAYKIHPCLYMIHSPLYKNKHARNEALEKIKLTLNNVRSGTTTSEIKMKYNSLRGTFLAERRKMLSSQKSGAGRIGLEARKSTDSISKSNSEAEEIVAEIQVDDEFILDNTELFIDTNTNKIIEHSDMDEFLSPSTRDTEMSSCSGIHDHQNAYVEHTSKPKGKGKECTNIDIMEDASNAISKMPDTIGKRKERIQKPENDYIGNFLAYIRDKMRKINDEAILDELEDDINRVVSNA